MPGNEAYNKLLHILLPKWWKERTPIDIDLRTIGILGLQRFGKTTLAFTIANDLEQILGDELQIIYAHFLHNIDNHIDRDLLRDKRYVLIIIEDATGFLSYDQKQDILRKEGKTYWRICHWAKRKKLKTHTGFVGIIFNYHTYMMMKKFFRNNHALVVKSFNPRYQKHEHEDISLPTIDRKIIEKLTYDRIYGTLDEVLAALSKAILVEMNGKTSIIEFKPIFKKPTNMIDIREEQLKDIESEEAGSEEEMQERIRILEKKVKTLTQALARVIISLGLRVRRDKKYLRLRIDGSEISLGAIADDILPLVRKESGKRTS